MLFVMAPTMDMDGFSEFWQAYPCHKARKDAEKAWRQVKGAKHQAAILAAITAQKAERTQPGWHPAWAYPASWLRAERWTDEVALSARLTLADDPCVYCGHPEPRFHSRTECLAREKALLSEQKARA